MENDDKEKQLNETINKKRSDSISNNDFIDEGVEEMMPTSTLNCSTNEKVEVTSSISSSSSIVSIVNRRKVAWTKILFPFVWIATIIPIRKKFNKKLQRK